MYACGRYSALALALVLAAIAGNHSFQRLTLPMPAPVPVDRFPRTLGGWTAGPDVPVDAEVRRTLPTATILNRVYTNSQGESISVVLVTASRYEDFHDPNWCLLGQGWTPGPRTEMRIGGTTANCLAATRGQQTLQIVYWLAGNTAGQSQGSLSRLQRLRGRLLGVEGRSLMVRLTATPEEAPKETLIDFATRAEQVAEKLVPHGAMPEAQ